MLNHIIDLFIDIGLVQIIDSQGSSDADSCISSKDNIISFNPLMMFRITFERPCRSVSGRLLINLIPMWPDNVDYSASCKNKRAINLLMMDISAGESITEINMGADGQIDGGPK